MILRGNKDYGDILKGESSICLEQSNGVFYLRAKLPDNLPADYRPFESVAGIIKVDFTSGDEIKTSARLPITLLDSSSWSEFQIPYDVTEWLGSDSCNLSMSSIAVHLEISVWNGLSDLQGGPLTFSEVVIDNVCLDELVSTTSPTLERSIKVSPNPNSGEFVIELPHPASQKTTMQVISMTGELLFEKKAESGTDLQLIEAWHLPSGIYFLQIVENGRVMSIDKFVKM